MAPELCLTLSDPHSREGARGVQPEQSFENIKFGFLLKFLVGIVVLLLF